MSKAQDIAYKLRWLILIVGILFVIAAITWIILPLFFSTSNSDFSPMGLIGTPLTYPSLVVDKEGFKIIPYIINVILVLGLLLIAQWAFLLPGKGLTVRLLEEGRPMKSSVIVAAGISTLLTIGLVSLILELPDWWRPLVDESIKGYIAIWIGMLISWIIWALIFFIYWKQGDRYTQMSKIIRGLVVGSFLEIAVAIPVHIDVTRQRECYCCRGTYTTLILAGTVLIWAFGPGIVLLFLREKYRRQKLLNTKDNPDKPEVS